MLDDAIRLARIGFAIHWLHPKSKRPIGEDWSKKDVLSVDQLRGTYRDGNNVGVRLGDWSKVSGYYLHVIDLDIRDPSLLSDATVKLADLFPAYQSYPTVQSGSMGHSRHFYVVSDRPFQSKKLAHSTDKIQTPDGKWHWAWEIELFGTGKQVAAPPSIHPDTNKPYRWLKQFDADDLDLGLGPIISSERLSELTGDDREDEALPDDERAAPLGLTLDEIRDVLDDLPKDYWRDDRDGWLAVGFALHHETEGSDNGFKLWHDFSKDSEKFDKSDQKRVWKSFRSTGVRKPLRMATLVAAAKDARLQEEFDNLDDLDDLDAGDQLEEFDDVLGPNPEKQSKREQKLKKAETEAALGHVPPKIARLNRKHAVAFVKGKTVIITENSDGSTSYGTPTDMHAWYENDRVATEKSTEPVSKAWMRHKMRREYPNGITFSPGLSREGYFNHWKGWSVLPDDEGSCELWLKHLKEVICSNNEVHFRYALGWFAHMVQKPWEKPGVAMVLRGKKRIGKDTIMDYFGGLCADNHVKIASQEQMTGKFNAHQEKCLILHVEEGFWAGNKQAEGSLKHLITSEKVLIEPKGVNAFHVESHLRIFMSSNEDWVVPATSDEGRYFVLEVSAARKDDHAYFRKLRQEMLNGGRAALLKYLMDYDLSEFEVRDVPDSEALGQQKLQGLKNIDRFWFDMLDTAEMSVDHGQADGKPGSWLTGAIRVDRVEFQDRYRQWLVHRKFDGAEAGPAIVGKRLNELLNGKLETIRGREGKKRSRQYVFPALPDCRKHFETYLGSTVTWDEAISDEDGVLDDADFDDLADI